MTSDGQPLRKGDTFVCPVCGEHVICPDPSNSFGGGRGEYRVYHWGADNNVDGKWADHMVRLLPARYAHVHPDGDAQVEDVWRVDVIPGA